jgi:hypothetical protein
MPKYILSLIIIFCLIAGSAFAKTLTKVEAKAIMSNITAVIYLEQTKVVVPVPPPNVPDIGKKPTADCPTGNCPTAQSQPPTQNYETYSTGRWRLFNR